MLLSILKMLSGLGGAAAGFAGGVATGGLSGGMSGITSGFAAGKEGKAGQAYSQVRDEQAKLLGKTPGGLKGKYQNKMMQHSVKKHTGLPGSKREGSAPSESPLMEEAFITSTTN